MARITLDDVSRAAGVSRSTASLVLRGSSKIPEATSEKVRRAMAELGYVYNRSAANLRQSRSMTLGLIVTEIINPYFAELAMAADEIAHEAGYTIFIGYSHDEAGRQHELMTAMIERQVDGFLILPAPDSDPNKIVSLITTAKTPTVTVARRIEGLDYVGSDNIAGGELLGNHLASIGCRTVAFLGGLPASSTSERCKGLAQELTARGIEFWNDDEHRSRITPTGGAEATAAMLDRGRLPDAVVAYNDIVALGIYEELRRRELRPGEDIAVASFDDTRLAATQAPPLTSVAGFPEEIGRRAARRLLHLLDDGQNTPISDLVPPKLRLRSSTVTWRPRGAN
ncbi:LacI family DNA-binding transcriptional regulator [Sinomonas sp. P10A9]|uniref:LacI family DNA-binding transcriptional regulator n=1 Tax=Sinomonas puerhi TaxID=3238584 RepID=A0AB39L6Q0_9MICC